MPRADADVLQGSTALTSITSALILRRRLQNQKLVRSTLRTPDEVVRSLVAMQAQDYPGAKWAVGQRAKGLTDVKVERAFEEGRLLRTHVLRPTWHFVTPADLRWLLTVSAPRVHACNGTVYRHCGLDAAVLTRSRRIIERALSEKTFLTRQELASAFTRGGIAEASGVRLAYLMMHAELEGLVCSGPTRGKQFTYALFVARVPADRAIGRDEALARLTERYFTSRGPATIRDFVWWSGLTVGEAKRGIEAVGSRLQSEVCDGQTLWSSTSSRTGRPLPTPLVHLLPNYDELGIAYKDRQHSRDVTPGRSGSQSRDDFAHLFVIDGRLRGSWKRAPGVRGTSIELMPYRPLSPAEGTALSRAVERYGRFFGVSARVRILTDRGRTAL